MKKFLLLTVLTVSMIFLVSCTKYEDYNNITEDIIVSTKFINKSVEYNKLEDSEVDLYYFKDDLNPYIDIETFFNMLDGLFYSDELEFITNITDQTLNINYDVSFDDETNESYEVLINFDLDYLEVEDSSFFDYYIQSTSVDYSEGLISLDPIINKGNKVIYDFKEYNMDLIIKDNKYLMPLYLANLMFNQSNYFDAYYNGDVIYGIDTSSYMDPSNEKDLKSILKSSYNNKQLHQSVIDASYNYMEFTIHYFYGLKQERNIINSKEFLNKYKDGLDQSNLYRRINDIIFDLDDLHSSHLTRGFYANKALNTGYQAGKYGPNITAFYKGRDNVVNEAAKYFGVKNGYVDLKEFEVIGNNDTLVIYLLEFDVDTPKEVEEIIKEHNNVSNIVIDLTLNTGGNLGAVLRILALMTNDTIKYHVSNPLDNSSASYLTKGEKEAYSNFNYYIKTSSVTFSAANLMTSIGKDMGIPILGQKTSGGASSLSFYVSPDGSIFWISSNTVLSRINNLDQYESIENGIEPTTKLTNLYDKTEINKAIENNNKNN